MNIKAIIVDDEESSILSLKGLLKAFCSEVEVVATAKYIHEAVMHIDNLKPDIVFLDVELGAELSFKLFTLIPEPSFQFIFTTAHEKYALRALKLSCIDYLLKPIQTGELMDAIYKYKKNISFKTPTEKIQSLLANAYEYEKPEKITAPTSDGFSLIDIADIVCIESDGNYSNIYFLDGSKIYTSKTLKEFDELLTPIHFFRSHRSFLLQLKHIKKYNKQENRILMNNGRWVELSIKKKEEFLELIKNISF